MRKLPKVAAGWTQIRDMPAPAKKTFHQMWRKRDKVDWSRAEEPKPH